MEQGGVLVGECFVKAAHIVLTARVHQDPPGTIDKRKGKWVRVLRHCNALCLGAHATAARIDINGHPTVLSSS